ncbi:AraC family transcriptional regulator [Photobacterium proteolyticum]|uniref:AraC family transcriptional regulator n=1 Tax=Photobacterium proteolyticum TaxID=1903952 RepID=A0A1Q9G661_9GAMM|nr:helix-turn-helix domain-containing protein [Photobacterium proteolyticum]OLQ69459.1 AraC family transcriptional regulator [Photobacterium proteolyticum]
MSQKRQFTGALRDTNSSFLPPQRPDTAPLHVVFVLLEHFSLVSFTSAADTLVTSNLVTTSQRFTFSTVGIDSTQITSDLGIKISADQTLDELSYETRIDLLVVCGGFRSQLEEIPKLSRKLRQIAARKARFGGIWNGALALAHAGVLKEVRYALHPDNHAYAREHFPASKITELAYVIEDKIISAAGPSSSLEMMLVLIEQLQGIEIVNAVKEILSCDRATQPTELPKFREVFAPSTPQMLQDAVQLMTGNMEEPLSIDELASWIGSSRRKLERLFRIHLQTSPSRYYLELRLTHARQLLLQSNDSVATIAAASGFVTTTYFSRCFKEFFSVSPLALRKIKRGDE